MSDQRVNGAEYNTDWVEEFQLAEFKLRRLIRIRDKKRKELERLNNEIDNLRDFVGDSKEEV